MSKNQFLLNQRQAKSRLPMLLKVSKKNYPIILHAIFYSSNLSSNNRVQYSVLVIIAISILFNTSSTLVANCQIFLLCELDNSTPRLFKNNVVFYFYNLQDSFCHAEDFFSILIYAIYIILIFSFNIRLQEKNLLSRTLI